MHIIPGISTEKIAFNEARLYHEDARNGKQYLSNNLGHCKDLLGFYKFNRLGAEFVSGKTPHKYYKIVTIVQP